MPIYFLEKLPMHCLFWSLILFEMASKQTPTTRRDNV